jgi:hypothetical protein
VQLFATLAARRDQPGVFQHAQMFHRTKTRHIEFGAEFGQRSSVALIKYVEQMAPAGVGQRSEHLVHVLRLYVTKWSHVKRTGVRSIRIEDRARVRTAVVALGDIEIVSQGPYDVESAPTLAEKVRGQLRSEREAGAAIENV